MAANRFLGELAVLQVGRRRPRRAEPVAVLSRRGGDAHALPGLGAAWRLCLLLLLASCRTVAPPATAPAPNLAPLPERFTARQSVVFEFRPHWWWPTIRLTALGYASVNRPADAYTVVCLTPLGVKLFDVSRTNGQNQANVALPLPGDAAKAGQAIGDDIAALYLGLTPPPAAVPSRHGDRLTFRHREAGQTTEWVFSTATGQLHSKTVTGDGVCRALTFSDYHAVGGTSYPTTLTLQNRRFGYRIIVRIQDLQPVP